jgi:hypothetical protein
MLSRYINVSLITYSKTFTYSYTYSGQSPQFLFILLLKKHKVLDKKDREHFSSVHLQPHQAIITREKSAPS